MHIDFLGTPVDDVDMQNVRRRVTAVAGGYTPTPKKSQPRPTVCWKHAVKWLA